MPPEYGVISNFSVPDVSFCEFPECRDLAFFFTVVSIEPGTLPDLGPQMLLVKWTVRLNIFQATFNLLWLNWKTQPLGRIIYETQSAQCFVFPLSYHTNINWTHSMSMECSRYWCTTIHKTNKIPADLEMNKFTNNSRQHYIKIKIN